MPVTKILLYILAGFFCNQSFGQLKDFHIKVKVGTVQLTDLNADYILVSPAKFNGNDSNGSFNAGFWIYDGSERTNMKATDSDGKSITFSDNPMLLINLMAFNHWQYMGKGTEMLPQQNKWPDRKSMLFQKRK